MLLSLDASISSTGYCVMNENTKEVIACWKINTTTKDTDAKRLFKICTKCEELVKEYEIDKVVIEGQYVHKNKNTALKLASLMGALMVTFTKLNCKMYKMQPSKIRQLLLFGDADKEEIAKYVQILYKDNKNVNTLGEFNDRQCKAKNSDIYDAISIALAYLKGLEVGENIQQI